MKTRVKKRICEICAWLAFLLMLGVIGGMDAGSIRFGAGAAWAFGLEAVGLAALWKAGWIKWRR